MLFTTHSVIGAAVGVLTGNPYAGFAGGVLSHHVLDALPHFDQGSFYTTKSGAKYLGTKAEHSFDAKFSRRDWVMLFADLVTAGVLFLTIFAHSPASAWPLIVWGALGGLLPDIIDSSPLWSKKLRENITLIKKYNSFHVFFHWTVARDEIALGVITQLILLTASLSYLLF